MRAIQPWIVAVSVSSSLASAVVRCGEKVCSTAEYCSENAFCTSCEDICNSSSNNYDMHTCQQECKGYMNTLYVRREDLEEAVSRVYRFVAVSIIISVLVLILVLAAFFTVWLKYQRIKCYKNKGLKKKMESIKAVCVNEVDGGKKLKLEMPAAQEMDRNREQSPPSALTTMTPLSTRHPTEDATLEYAYDNPTLSHSPIFPKNQPQSTPNTTPKTIRTETSF